MTVEPNAPERWTIQGSYREHGSLPVSGRLLDACERVEVVDAAAYDRVVAERDEAIVAAGELAARLWRLPAEQRDLVLGDAPEGEQPAGETVPPADLTLTDRDDDAVKFRRGLTPGVVVVNLLHDGRPDPGRVELYPRQLRELHQWLGRLLRVHDWPAAGVQSDRESMPREARQAAIRRAAETVRSGSGWVQRAGVQSTIETGPVAWLIVWQDDIDPPVREVTLAADRARIAAQWGKRTTALYEHPSPSTTETATGPNRGTCDVHAWVGRDGDERCPDCVAGQPGTATGHDYSLLDAVMPAEGQRRERLLGLMVDAVCVDDSERDAWRSDLGVAYDVLRAAASSERDAAAPAPATPETESEASDA